MHPEGIAIGHDSGGSFNAKAATKNDCGFAIDRTIADSQFID